MRLGAPEVAPSAAAPPWFADSVLRATATVSKVTGAE